MVTSTENPPPDNSPQSPQWARSQFTRTLFYQTGSKNGVIWNSDTGVNWVVPQNYDVCPLLMMHKTCSINYGHLADLQKTLPTTDLNKKKLSFDKISPRDFYFFPFFSICTCVLFTRWSFGISQQNLQKCIFTTVNVTVPEILMQ